MAFDKYKNGAWTEPEDSVRRYDKASGTWVECDNAKRYKDGAWQDVWTGMKTMTVLSSSLTNGTFDISDDKTKLSWSAFEDFQQQVGSLSCSGYIELVLEGEWMAGTTVSFDWYGGANWWNDTITKCTHRNAGAVTLRYGYRSSNNGNLYYGNIITTDIYESKSADSSVFFASGTVSTTLQATNLPTTAIVERVILKIYPTPSYTSTYNYGTMDIQISNFMVDGVQYGFSPEIESYSKYINDYA